MPKHQQILFFVIVKWLFVPSLGLKKPQFQKENFSDNHLQKVLEKFPKKKLQPQEKQEHNIQ